MRCWPGRALNYARDRRVLEAHHVDGSSHYRIGSDIS